MNLITSFVMPFQYKITLIRFKVALLPECPPYRRRMHPFENFFLQIIFLPNYQFALPSQFTILPCEMIMRTRICLNLLNNLFKISSIDQFCLILANISDWTWCTSNWQHSDNCTLDKASTAMLSWPCLYSIAKSNSISLTNHFCWK